MTVIRVSTVQFTREERERQALLVHDLCCDDSWDFHRESQLGWCFAAVDVIRYHTLAELGVPDPRRADHPATTMAAAMGHSPST